MDHSFLSALILLLLVLDPLGSLPIFISIMRAVPKPRRKLVAGDRPSCCASTWLWGLASVCKACSSCRSVWSTALDFKTNLFLIKNFTEQGW